MSNAPRMWALLAALCALAEATEHHVATTGRDEDPGTSERPFRTIAKAAATMQPGDTCFVHGGVYRETATLTRSGREGKPIRFTAWPGEAVTLSGTEPIKGAWSVHKGSIHKTRVGRAFAQLFVDGQMMIEARWPNATFAQRLDRACWARAGRGSRYGKMVDPKLARTGIDWTGALATLNVAHQFFTWTRTVREHGRGRDTFAYDRNFPGITHYANKTRQWEDDFYYLSGKLEALDSPGEWFLDAASRTLYLWPPDGKSPAAHTIEAKVRDYAFVANNVAHVELSGFHLFAATFQLSRCSHCLVEGCHLLFPTFGRRIREMDSPRSASVKTSLTGSHNILRSCSLAYDPNAGLVVRGDHNLVENNLVRDVCWHGCLVHTGISLGPLARRSPPSADAEEQARKSPSCGSAARRNTVLNSGNTLVHVGGMAGIVVEHNHILRGGLACRDVSLLYTQLPHVFGTVFRYNWVHDCAAPQIALGIRGDDQTRGLHIHHNVVWNCGWDGAIVKGDHNSVYNNTCLSNGQSDILAFATPEPKKPWRKQFPLLKVQNRNSEIANNCAVIRGGRGRRARPVSARSSHNYQGQGPMLADPAHLDFRPRPGSPLIDAGKVIPGITDGHKGTAPDVGAYEHGGERWVPGCRNGIWLAASEEAGGLTLRVALTMPVLAAVELDAAAERPGARTAPAHKLRFTPQDWMGLGVRPQLSILFLD